MLKMLDPYRWIIGGTLATLAVLFVWRAIERHDDRIRTEVYASIAETMAEANAGIEANNAASDARLAAAEAKAAASGARLAAGRVRNLPQCARDCSLLESERAALAEAAP